jgi:hypothetical protein
VQKSEKGKECPSGVKREEEERVKAKVKIGESEDRKE